MSSRKIPLICSGHSRPVPDLSYSKITQDGFFVVSACLDGKPMLRNGETGDWIGTFLGHKGAVWSAHLNSTATQAVTGSADYTAKIWDSVGGDEKHTFTHSKIVKSVQFSNDNSMILTGGLDKLLRIFDLSKPDADPLKLEGHSNTIKTALWCGGDQILVSGGSDNELRIWDRRTLKQEKSIPFKSAITSIELCLDKKHMIVTCGKDITFYDAQSFELIKTYNLPIEVNSASLSPDGSIFVAGGTDFSVRLYDFATGKEQEILKGHHGPVHCTKFAPDGNVFASGSEDGTIRLWQKEPKSYGLWQENVSKEKTEVIPPNNNNPIPSPNTTATNFNITSATTTTNNS